MPSAINQFPGALLKSSGVSGTGVINLQDTVSPSSTADCSASLIRAVSACSDMGGGVIWLGAGAYVIAAQISLPSSVAIVGAGKGATTISNTCSGDLFLMDSVHHCAVKDLTITAPSVRSAGAAVHVLGGDTSVQLGTFKMSRAQHLINVDLNNQYDGVVVEDKSATNGAWGVTIGSSDEWGFFRNHAVGRFPIDINTPHGGSIKINQPWLIGNATPANGPAGIRVRGSGDTSIAGVRTWGVQRGLIVDPQVNGAETVMAIDVSGDAYFDFAENECFRFNPIAGLTIPIEITCTGTWFASSRTTHNIYGSNGTGHKVKFRGCTSINAAGWGLRGDTGCTSASFPNTDMDFGPPFVNASGDASYV